MSNDRYANDRKTVAINLLAATLVRVQAWLSRKHLRDQYPQMAIFSFDHIGERINAFGRYENDVLHALIRFLEQRGTLGRCCADVGANIGNHTVFFAQYFSAVHAFEPSRRTFALLSENVRNISNVVPHRIALSDAPGEQTLVAPLDNIGQGSLVHSDRAGERVERDVVQVATLDAIDAMQSLDIGLIKIDVEGLEAQVLRGAEATLQRCRPVIVFEQQPEDIAGGTSESIQLLKAMGYSRFYRSSRWPSTPFRALTIPAKLLLGEQVFFEEVERFERAYYPMIVAVP